MFFIPKILDLLLNLEKCSPFDFSTDDENSENRRENIEDTHGKQNDDKLKDTLFSRIEESRQVLEEELGFDMFMKIYKHVQVAFYWFVSVPSS